MSYKVIYHEGDHVELRTKVRTGQLSLEDGLLQIHDGTVQSISFDSILSVELFRLHRAGRMLKITHTHGHLFVSVIRFNLFGYFALVNHFATGRLQGELEALIAKERRV
ncbi:MAG: hypothetical protein WD045_11125 [Pirellulaceae bacterium]